MLLRSGSEDSPLLGGADHGDRDSPSSWGSDPPSQPSDRLLAPQVNTPHRAVHSQASMDSGCDCDPSEVDSLPHTLQTSTHNSQPGSSTSSNTLTKGPPSLVAPLAQKESLDCQCGTLDQTRVCDSCRRVCDTPNVGTKMTHTDRGELPNIHSYGDRYRNQDPCGSRGFSNTLPTFKVTFKLGYDEEYEIDPTNAASECNSPTGTKPEDEFKDLVRSSNKSFPRVPSYNKPGMLSASSSTASMPMCRICHFPQGEGVDMLISPCRCSGTMQFIHEGCLMKWLEISSKRKKPATCELCYYQFNRHKKFRFTHWKLPVCSGVDKILHSVFLLCLLVMATCATITIYCFKQDRFIKKREDTDLTQSEIVTLTCGVLFFVAFFMAMYVEVKAKDTLYKILSKFLYLNQTWHIDEYDKRRDNLHAQI